MTRYLCVSVILFCLLNFPVVAQDKEPVAITDTIIFPISYEPYYIIKIKPLENDFSQDMHPVVIHAIWDSELTINSSFNDSVITLLNFGYEGIDSIEYQIRDTINNLTSNRARIYILSQTGSFSFLEVNNIKARINANGIHFRKYLIQYPESDESQFFVDRGRTYREFNLWIAGKDQSGIIHSAPSWYLTSSPASLNYRYKYWPGPASQLYPDSFDQTWERVWVIYKQEIDWHLSHFNDPGYIMPEAIENWPAHGDTSIGQAQNLAPYVDHNEDDIYNPDQGDYPLIKGDQAIYFICNDDRDEETTPDMPIFKTEIHGMAYSYNCPEDSNIQNTIFFHYKLFNRSDKIYSHVYVGANVQAMIGHYHDDYAGCDTTLHSFFGYNKNPIDTGNYSFGISPPAQSVTFLNHAMTHFIYYGESYLSYCNSPDNPIDYYDYLNGFWYDSTHLTYGSNGHEGNKPINHIFPGNPGNPYEWTMKSTGVHYNGQMHCLGSTGPFTLEPGESITLDLAITYARDYGGNNLSSVNLLKQRIRKIKQFYNFNNNIPCQPPSEIHENISHQFQRILLFPNPTKSSFYIQGISRTEDIEYYIFNIDSRLVSSGKVNTTEPVSTNGLSKGIYIVRIKSSYGLSHLKLIRQ